MFKYLIKKELRYSYPTLLSWVSMLGSELIILALFWYTAKAFIPSEKLFGDKSTSYFSFIVIGLAVIRLPSFLLTIFTRKIKETQIEGTLESIELLPRSSTLSISYFSLASSLLELIRIVLIIAMAMLLFGLAISVKQMAIMILLQAIVAPLFIGIGFIASAVYLRFGRGDALVAKFASLGGILSGAYFPIEVLPNSISTTLVTISPFNMVVTLSRNGEITPLMLGAVLLQGAFFLILGYFLMEWSFKSFRRRSPLFHVS